MTQSSNTENRHFNQCIFLLYNCFVHCHICIYKNPKPVYIIIRVIAFLVSVPDGLAFDPVSRLLYLTDTGEDVIMAFTQDLQQNTIIISQGLEEPRGIALDPFKG